MWPRSADEQLFEVRAYRTGLFAMSSVCRRLRLVALHTPRCWATVLLQVSEMGQVYSSQSRTFLQRSGKCEWDLYISSAEYSESLPRDEIPIDLQPHAPKCRSVTVKVQLPTIPFLHDIENELSFSALRHFTIECNDFEQSSLNVYNNQFKLPIPFLQRQISPWRSISLVLGYSEHFQWTTGLLNTLQDFTSLVYLYLDAEFPSAWPRPLLMCCPNLEYLE